MKTALFAAANVLVVNILSQRLVPLAQRATPKEHACCAAVREPNNGKSKAPSAEKRVNESVVEATGDDCSGCPKSIANTVKNIDMHIVVCSPGIWVKRVENEEGSFMQLLNNAVMGAIKDNSINKKVKLTACDRENQDSDHVDVVVYPQAKMYRLPLVNATKAVTAFVNHIFLGAIIQDNIFSVGGLPWSRLVLICNHMSRDKRCGRAGPIIINECKKQLDEIGNSDQVAVFGTSHIGGHEYAGTLIIYPEGKCFGYITKNKVSALLDYVCNDSITAFDSLKDGCYRGQYNESW